jgi:very-short-patch-repair endonuclease
MFLSLVVANNTQFAALVKDSDRQRFNVATSRARDQVFLFHSVKLDHIRNPECMRYRLLEWYSKPPLAEIQYGIDILKQKAESDFEIEVGERIIKKGYKVIPQFRPLPNDFNYRIDLVIQGDKKLVGVECDGEKYHGPDRWEYDQRREAQLRRAGWKFWRISGSAFYRDKERSLESLWKFLENESVYPKPVFKEEPEGHHSMHPLGGAEEQKSFNLSPAREKVKEKIDEIKSDGKEYKESEKHNKEITETTTRLKNNNLPKEPPDRVAQIKEQLDLFDNWEIWQNLVIWGVGTGGIDSHSRAIGYQIVDKLKLGRKISPWLRNEMEKIWKTAIKKGFKPKTDLS